MMLFQFVLLWLMLQKRYLQITGMKESHDRTQQRTAENTIDKPNIISWELDGHYVIVNWQHSDANHSTHGYYVSLCQLVNSECTGPDFVNFGKSVRSGKIVGLAPEALYQVEVIAYSSDEHISSDPVSVNTKKLEFLLAKNLTVSLVTCCSAVFRWKHEASNNIHDVQFLLHCTGRREYINTHKKIVQEEHHFENLSHSTSNDIEMIIAENLDANTNYLCIMSSIAGTIQSPPSQQITFTTHPGIPSTPPTPILSLGKDSTLTASIYPTDERFGPISHYMLIGVPVTKSKTDPLTAPYQPIVPLKNLVVKALSSKTVNTISQPLPFIVASFEPKALPINYKFTYEWRSVFKQKTHYSVVLVVFTRGKNSNIFHSLSALSTPVYITEDLVENWLEEQRPVAKRFTVIVVSCILSVVTLFAIAFLILFISNYYYAKRRDAKDDYTFAISDTGSSEEEIFTKGESNREKLLGDQRPMSSKGVESLHRIEHNERLTKLSVRSPNMTHADWAMENMSRSPAFREMILEHPETLDEMNEVMSKIGHKWELNQYEKATKTMSEVKINDPIDQEHNRGMDEQLISPQSSFSEPYSPPHHEVPPPVPVRFHGRPHRQGHRQGHHRSHHQSHRNHGYDDLMSDVDLMEQHYR